jgi:hypothetical protein
MGRTACTEPQCQYSRAITLLPLWAVRPVQSLSACTRVTFTFTFLPTAQLQAERSGDRIPVGSEIYHTRPDRLWGPPSLLYHGYRVFPEGKAAGTLTTHHHLAPKLKKEYSYISTPLSGNSWPLLG